MTKPHYHPFFLSIGRLCRLAGWLMASAWRISRFERMNARERDAALMGIAERILGILNIHVDANCQAQCPARPPLLVVANHISWLDIFVLMSLYPSGFIAKQSIREWPVVGNLAAQVGTVFINRESRQDAAAVSRCIAQSLADGQSVTFFPEARTSDGLTVLPFKAALFQSAIDTATPVQAMALRYYTPAGIRNTEAAWVGEVSFYASLWRIVRLGQIHVQVDFAPLMQGSATASADRFALKEAAEHFIRQKVSQP